VVAQPVAAKQANKISEGSFVIAIPVLKLLTVKFLEVNIKDNMSLSPFNSYSPPLKIRLRCFGEFYFMHILIIP
jgi:hypothetical protein